MIWRKKYNIYTTDHVASNTRRAGCSARSIALLGCPCYGMVPSNAVPDRIRKGLCSPYSTMVAELSLSMWLTVLPFSSNMSSHAPCHVPCFNHDLGRVEFSVAEKITMRTGIPQVVQVHLSRNEA